MDVCSHRTSALDAASTQLVESTLLSLRREKLTVWVTHSAEQCARVASHVLALDKTQDGAARAVAPAGQDAPLIDLEAGEAR